MAPVQTMISVLYHYQAVVMGVITQVSLIILITLHLKPVRLLRRVMYMLYIIKMLMQQLLQKAIKPLPTLVMVTMPLQ